jgi:hypothetical protein
MIKKNLLAIGIITAFLSISVLSCSKENDKNPVDGVVDIYLLKTFERISSSYAIIDSTVITEDKPFIKYSDLLSYDPKDHVFSISLEIHDSIENIHFPTIGTAFAVKVSNKIIYTGYFWPSYSSAGCNWVVIDPIMIDYYGGLKVELGYPGRIEGQQIPDNRNDKKIIDIFKRDGKLIK